MVLIRTDANDVIATGHMMRCLTIAEQFCLLGEKVIFVVSDKNSIRLLNDTNYKYVCLNCSWNELDAMRELDDLRSYMGSALWMIIDTYSANNDYVKIMKSHFKVACFDDMFEEKYDADIVINYNLYYKNFDYETRYLNSETKLLLGGKYVPLRKQFQDSVINREWKQSYYGKKILLICGGGDPQNCMGKIVNWMACNCEAFFKEWKWEIVVGNYNCYEEQLEGLQKKYKNIHLNYNVKNMAELMNECYICVSAASTVLYECCAMNIPTIFFCTVENQKYDAEYFGRDKMMIYAGDIRMEEKDVWENISINLKKIATYRNIYENMVSSMQDIVDVKGAWRIVSNILSIKCI